jgi:hypothetical protein
MKHFFDFLGVSLWAALSAVHGTCSTRPKRLPKESLTQTSVHKKTEALTPVSNYSKLSNGLSSLKQSGAF